MKIITLYKCEICGREYDSQEKAEECEKDGYFDISRYPIGLMYSWHHNGYVGIFAINTHFQYIGNKHLGSIGTWCFRTKGYPPYTLGEHSCAYPYYLKNSDASNSLCIPKEEVGNKEFTNMVEYLKKEGITPSYYEKDSNKLIQL